MFLNLFFIKNKSIFVKKTDMHKINKYYLQRIKKDLFVKAQIVAYVSCNKATVNNWVKTNNPALTTWGVLTILEEAYNVPKEEIVTL